MTILTLPTYDHYSALYLILIRRLSHMYVIHISPILLHPEQPRGKSMHHGVTLAGEGLRPIVKLVIVELIFTTPLTIFPLWVMLTVLELVEQGEGGGGTSVRVRGAGGGAVQCRDLGALPSVGLWSCRRLEEQTRVGQSLL